MENTNVETHDHDEEHIHMPAPSWAPIILALGMAGLGFGTIWIASLPGLAFVIAGVVLLLIGLVRWIYEDIKTAGDVH